MHAPSQEVLTTLLKRERIKPRLIRELRYVPDEIRDWEDRELAAIPNRSGSEGVLLAELDLFYVIPFMLSRGITDKHTGRSKPITCDFCYTWRQGGSAGNISFVRPSDGHTITFLCCADLDCSLHVRDKTDVAALSRTQLHEDMTTEQRVNRLRTKLGQIMEIIGAQPVQEL